MAKPSIEKEQHNEHACTMHIHKERRTTTHKRNVFVCTHTKFERKVTLRIKKTLAHTKRRKDEKTIRTRTESIHWSKNKKNNDS